MKHSKQIFMFAAALAASVLFVQHFGRSNAVETRVPANVIVNECIFDEESNQLASFSRVPVTANLRTRSILMNQLAFSTVNLEQGKVLYAAGLFTVQLSMPSMPSMPRIGTGSPGSIYRNGGYFEFEASPRGQIVRFRFAPLDVPSNGIWEYPGRDAEADQIFRYLLSEANRAKNTCRRR